VNGQKIGFVIALFLQTTLVRGVAVTINHALTEPGLPGKRQHIAIEIAVLRCLEIVCLCGEYTECERHRARRNNDILPEHLIS
jgi:hypothetical protein